MAWKRPDGNMSQVTIASLGDGVDTLFLNFLNPPLVEAAEPCVGVCEGGLKAGHMDVDSDGDYAGKTDKHKHEYDIEHNRTYVDYFDMDPKNESKPRAVTHHITDVNQEFIVLIANADWSTGAELQIGNVTYNVAEYQSMLHQALAAWDPEDDDDELEDPAGNPLIHTLTSLTKDGGTLRNTFKATALIYGGLIPAKTNCVKDEVYKEKDGVLVNLVNDRWRNNALVMQLVDADYVRDVQDIDNDDGNQNGNYSDLLQTLNCPSDFGEYGEYYDEAFDDGYWGGGTWCGETAVGGYWVWDNPNWYVWENDNEYRNDGREQPLDRLRVQAPPDIFPKITLSDGTMIILTDDKDDDGLEGDSPEYEVYGGLTAKNEESFLYESTVFWHWNDGDQPDLCYADTEEYRNAYKEVTGQIPMRMFLDKLEAATTFTSIEDLTEYVESLQSCKDTANSAGGCSDEWEAIEALAVESEMVGQQSSGGGDENSELGGGGGLSGEPQIMEGGISEAGITSGPNFATGRRTWTDILPE
jgi:hypothetical protein